MNKQGFLLLLLLGGCNLTTETPHAPITAKDAHDIEACQTIGFDSVISIDDQSKLHLVCTPKDVATPGVK